MIWQIAISPCALRQLAFEANERTFYRFLDFIERPNVRIIDIQDRLQRCCLKFLNPNAHNSSEIGRVRLKEALALILEKRVRAVVIGDVDCREESWLGAIRRIAISLDGVFCSNTAATNASPICEAFGRPLDDQFSPTLHIRRTLKAQREAFDRIVGVAEWIVVTVPNPGGEVEACKQLLQAARKRRSVDGRPLRRILFLVRINPDADEKQSRLWRSVKGDIEAECMHSQSPRGVTQANPMPEVQVVSLGSGEVERRLFLGCFRQRGRESVMELQHGIHVSHFAYLKDEKSDVSTNTVWCAMKKSETMDELRRLDQSLGLGLNF